MHRSRDRSPAPVAITAVAPSLDDQHDARRRKYLIMMGLRIVCVVAAAAVFRSSLWLALLFIVGGAVLPWCAVLIANDRPARSRTAFIGYRPPSQGQLPRQQSRPNTPPAEAGEFDGVAFIDIDVDGTPTGTTRPGPAPRPPDEWLDPHQNN